MREQPSADMIDERLAAWQAGDYPESWSVYDALGWSRNEYMTWLADPSRVPERPLSALPDPEIYGKRRRAGTLRVLEMASGSGVPFLKDFRHGSFAA
jgi:hypothetical protein